MKTIPMTKYGEKYYLTVEIKSNKGVITINTPYSCKKLEFQIKARANVNEAIKDCLNQNKESITSMINDAKREEDWGQEYQEWCRALDEKRYAKMDYDIPIDATPESFFKR